MHTLYLNEQELSLADIRSLQGQPHRLAVSEDCRRIIRSGRRFLENKLADERAVIYGINTGFGSLCDQRIDANQAAQLQLNIIRSHACGTGERVPKQLVKLMMLLKIKSLILGHSGVRELLIDRLLHYYNEDIIPVIYQQGSLGASGDLAPLAHLSLALIGEGDIEWRDKIRPAGPVLDALSLRPITPVAKEGLALLNGTQFSTAYALWAYLEAQKIADTADLIGALSCDAFFCRTEPFDDRIHQLRPHPGQIKAAERIRYYLRDSDIAKLEKKAVQDPYAFRCIPQVHGASRDALAYAAQTLLIELNAVTDNPNIFPDSNAILSGGNFHAQPIALIADHMAIALSEFGSISERRTFQLISGSRDLPPFLTPNPGLHSGLMIPQYTAASIASQNKQLCTPASVDSIVSSNGQEDHVSMAANAGTKLYRVVENVKNILAIEFLTATQALHLRRPHRTGSILEKTVQKYRQIVPPITNDRIFSTDIQKTKEFLFALEGNVNDV